MSPLWDLLIHCFGTRLANTRENFDVPSEKTSQQFLFMFAVFEIVRADSSLCILSLRSGFGFAFLLGLKLIFFFFFFCHLGLQIRPISGSCEEFRHPVSSLLSSHDDFLFRSLERGKKRIWFAWFSPNTTRTPVWDRWPTCPVFSGCPPAAPLRSQVCFFYTSPNCSPLVFHTSRPHSHTHTHSAVEIIQLCHFTGFDLVCLGGRFGVGGAASLCCPLLGACFLDGEMADFKYF